MVKLSRINLVVLRRLAVRAAPPPQRPAPGSSAGSLRAGGATLTHGRDPAGPWRRRPASERSSIVGLTALSVSDLLFCLVGIPAALLVTPGDGELAHVYHVCRVPLHNLFLFSSTWIAVARGSRGTWIATKHMGCHHLDCHRAPGLPLLSPLNDSSLSSARYERDCVSR